MRHTIEGFSQEYATTLKKEIRNRNSTKTIKIDCTDLVILRWFVDFYPRMKKFEIDGQEYAWLTHSKVLADLPLLDINQRSIIDRMQKLVEFNILTYKFINNNGGHSYYGFGENYINLINTNENSTVCLNVGGTVCSNAGGLCVQTYSKDNTIKDSSIKDNNNKEKEQKHAYGEFRNVSLTDDEYQKLNSKYGLVLTEKLIKFLDEYIEEKGYKSRSHYLAIKRWVVDAVNKHTPKRQNAERSSMCDRIARL